MAASQKFIFVSETGRREKAIRRRNPDGSVGGWVAKSAKVHPSAIVHVDAIVEPRAVVPANQVVGAGETVFTSSWS